MNTSQGNSKDCSKQLEYVKQQQQLRDLGNRMQNSAQSKALSAESMIEDLLSKRETFQKRVPEAQQKQEAEVPGPLPPITHPLYERVWLGVQAVGGLADTPLLSTLLMSSGLSTDTLGYIWSLANRSVPGALTQSEVYAVLALVALAQAGYVVNNLTALQQLPQAPVPTLDLTLLPPQVSVSQANPNPLNVSSLPDPVTFNWQSPETEYPNSSDKIGISYVSTSPMISPSLISDQITKPSMNINLTDSNKVDGSKNKITPSSVSVNIGHEQRNNSTHGHVKHSTGSFSFSFPILNDSPSHNANIKSEEIDALDDEFTEFQSADFTPTSFSAQVENKPTTFIKEEDEFTNFQKASSNNYNDDHLSVLVVGGRNIPSSQQLWVTDSPSLEPQSNIKRDEIKEMFDVIPNESVQTDHQAVQNQSFNISEKNHTESKYDVFQEIEDDKYSVFHNPLPDDEDKPIDICGNVHSEAKSIFQHSLFQDPSLNLFKSGNQTPNLDLPELDCASNHSKYADKEENDEKYSDFQKFSVSFPEETSDVQPTEKIDKYDIFRTIVFDNSLQNADNSFHVKQPNNTEDKLFDVQPFVDGVMNNTGNEQSGHDNKLIGDILETKTTDIDSFNYFQPQETEELDDITFGDFQESVALPPNNSLKIDSLFSSLAISENRSDKTNLYPAEDKYKAFRVLETSSSDTDEFGEFLGAELPNSGNTPLHSEKQMSIQIRCLEACLNLLKSGVTTFSQASSPEVVAEVLNDQRANSYLDCLLEVHRVSERILSEMTNDSCKSVKEELNQTWNELAPYFSHMQHSHMPETVGAVCGVCRSNTGPSPVTLGALSFHTPCANLYLHYVEPVLPNVAVQ